jgi:tRNA G18 (ribose-2'-O)-methylase SpoU
VPGHVCFVTDPADPRLDDYRDIKDRRLDEASGRFMAESELVVRRLLASGLPVDSVLLTAPRLAALEAALAAAPGDFPVLVAPQGLLDGVAGLPVHRGCLAVGRRPHDARVPEGSRLVVALEDLVDVDNVGALARNASAFGADALLLSPRCADPFYRKAIRVSAGAVLSLPMVRATGWPGALLALRERGFTLVAAVVDDAARPLARFTPPPRVAIVLGAEGPGLSRATRDLCDERVTIPIAGRAATGPGMAGRGADSLNVATAGAIFLHHVTSARA